MRPAQIHTRIIQHPFASVLQGGRLDSYHQNGRTLQLDIQALEINSSEFFARDGKIYERAQARHIPVQLGFSDITDLKRDEFFASLGDYAEDDPSRVIAYVLSWQKRKRQDIYYMFGLRGPIGADMDFFARRVTYEMGKADARIFTIERDWSPAPPMPSRLVPQPRHLYRSFGGDPITIKIDNQTHHRRLFIGGLENQLSYRPHVDAVLNLGEEPSRWVDGKTPHPADRVINKGEGSNGMTVGELHEEANWVLERLKKDQRVLVHCVAGMNRSTTICCAVLILLEGLSAEAALERIREHHPWARPDSYHWLALRWLEKNK
ncbi:MAG: dual specificity protein phosphatase [Chloroflexota bacterium]